MRTQHSPTYSSLLHNPARHEAPVQSLSAPLLCMRHAQLANVVHIQNVSSCELRNPPLPHFCNAPVCAFILQTTYACHTFSMHLPLLCIPFTAPSVQLECRLVFFFFFLHCARSVESCYNLSSLIYKQTLADSRILVVDTNHNHVLVCHVKQDS